MKRAIWPAFAGFIVALSMWADGAELFLPAATATGQNGTVAGARKEQLVRIARGELAVVRDRVTTSGAARLLLNMDAELELGVAVERTSRTRWGYSLSGRVDAPTVGFVTLVVHQEAVAGAIWTPDASYEIVHLGGGVHTVREVTDRMHQCGGSVAAFEAQPIVWPEDTAAEDGNSVVDVLVVWTPQREEEAGGPDAVRAEIELGIAYTNDAFERSGAFVSLNLVGAEPVDYDEVDSQEDLGRLIDPSDGYMDAVHRRRDALGADLVSLATHRGRGRAVVTGAFSVAGRYPGTVAHEFGHNFGLVHERSQWRSGSSRTYPHHYEHGYATSRNPRCSWTIMAYGQRCRGRSADEVPVFSSPALFHPADGVRLGVSRFSGRRGADGPADAVLHLNRARSRVARFKPRRSSRSD